MTPVGPVGRAEKEPLPLGKLLRLSHTNTVTQSQFIATSISRHMNHTRG